MPETSSGKAPGHLSATLTILLWGTTFISSKILLRELEPVEILFFRFIAGLAVLFLLYPKRLRLTDRRQELIFAAAGLCGVTLYYLFEIIALTYTYASNVGVIVSVSPLFTAMLTALFYKKKTITPAFITGFIIAMAGICLISFQGQSVHLSLRGDILSLCSAIAWGFYSVLCTKISSFGYPTIATTRRIFIYGIIFLIPSLFVLPFRPRSILSISPVGLANLLFLGVGASAVCFVTWNFAVKKLGAIQTSIYIYLIPVITVAASVLILHEKITLYSVIGIILTFAGLFISRAGK